MRRSIYWPAEGAVRDVFANLYQRAASSGGFLYGPMMDWRTDLRAVDAAWTANTQLPSRRLRRRPLRLSGRATLEPVGPLGYLRPAAPHTRARPWDIRDRRLDGVALLAVPRPRVRTLSRLAVCMPSHDVRGLALAAVTASEVRRLVSSLTSQSNHSAAFSGALRAAPVLEFDVWQPGSYARIPGVCRQIGERR